MPSAKPSSQNSVLSEFLGITQSDKKTAEKVLKQHNWQIQAAVDAFFSSPLTGASNATRTSLNKFFDKHLDDAANEPDEINIQGAGEMLGDIGVGLEDIGALIFFEIVKAPSLGRISREAFVENWSKLNVDTAPKMRNVILQRRSALASDRSAFKPVYEHAFTLALPTGSRTLPFELATEFWSLLFTPPGYEWSTSRTPWLQWWLEFHEAQHTKVVNKDVWKMTLKFAEESLDDDTLAFYSEEASWPAVIDEFVTWVKEVKRPHGGAEDAMAVD